MAVRYMTRALFLLLVAFVSACTTTSQQDIAVVASASDKAALKSVVRGYTAAFKAGNMGQVVDTLPPKFIPHVARQAGFSVADQRRQLITLLSSIDKLVVFKSYSMDSENATYHRLPDGQIYALVPTRTLLKTPKGKRVQAKLQTLALRENGRWYLIRVAKRRQQSLYKQTYPEFANVHFPKGQTKVLR